MIGLIALPTRFEDLLVSSQCARAGHLLLNITFLDVLEGAPTISSGRLNRFTIMAKESQVIRVNLIVQQKS